MKKKWKTRTALILCSMILAILWAEIRPLAAEPVSSGSENFPRSLDSYNDADIDGIWPILKNRVMQEPSAPSFFSRHT